MRDLWNWIRLHIVQPLGPILTIFILIALALLAAYLVTSHLGIALRPEIIFWTAAFAILLWLVQFPGPWLVFTRVAMAALVILALAYFFWPRGYSVAEMWNDAWRRTVTLLSPAPTSKKSNGKRVVSVEKESGVTSKKKSDRLDVGNRHDENERFEDVFPKSRETPVEVERVYVCCVPPAPPHVVVYPDRGPIYVRRRVIRRYRNCP